jgi:flagellar biosynthesis protein FlhF
MYLKRFRGTTVREALAAVRAELGPDALVLGTRMVPVTGWRGLTGQREVEISAATDRQVSEDRPPAATPPPAAPRGNDDIVARLVATGLAPEIAAEVAAAATPSRFRKASAARIRTALVGWSSAIAAGSEARAAVEVFVGPPGAGKTTTVAKIAAQGRVKGQRLALLAADGFRVGAIEQLKCYAEILDAPFAVARDASEVGRAILEAPGPVLIDTAGRSARDGSSAELCASLGRLPGVRTHLVVPASSTARDLDRLLDLHAEARPARVILSKMDEAESIAPLAGILRRRGLRVSYMGIGQRVPEDLVEASPEALGAALAGDAWLAGSAA